MPLSDCEPFKWYLVVTCRNCGHKQPLFRDTSGGKGRIRETYKHRCEQCQHHDAYEPEEIERYHHVVERRKKPRA